MAMGAGAGLSASFPATSSPSRTIEISSSFGSSRLKQPPISQSPRVPGLAASDKFSASDKDVNFSASCVENKLDEIICLEEARPLVSSSSDISSPPSTTALDPSVKLSTKRVHDPLFSAAEAAKERRLRIPEPELGFSDLLRWVWTGSRYSGTICMSLSCLIYSFMGFLVEFFEVQSLPSFEIIIFRCGVIAAAGFVVLKKTGQPLFGSPNIRLLLLARATVGYMSLLGFLYSIQALPLQDAIMLNFTSPLFTAIVARILLKEKCGVKEIGGALCSFLGLILVVQPYPFFIDKASHDESATQLYVQRHTNSVFPTFVALASAMAAGVTNCFVRTAAKATEQPLLTVLAFSAFSLPVSGFCMFAFQRFIVPGFMDFLKMIIVGLTSMLAQVFFARALQLDKAGKVTAIQYLEVAGLYFLQVLAWYRSPTLLSICGSTIIVISAVLVSYLSSES